MPYRAFTHCNRDHSLDKSIYFFPTDSACERKQANYRWRLCLCQTPYLLRLSSSFYRFNPFDEQYLSPNTADFILDFSNGTNDLNRREKARK